jgi:hypothetical protein
VYVEREKKVLCDSGQTWQTLLYSDYQGQHQQW